ncbi:aminopeptidase P family protein, partial [Klebsiella pneumoniae]|nr:aminopeptidase P family protein [Klebsiella pneumoniae]
EQQAIRESGEIVSQAVAQTIEHAKAGLTEMDIDNFGNSYLFDTISQNYPDAEFGFFVMSPSGIKRSTMPHTFSNTKQIQQGDVIV